MAREITAIYLKEILNKILMNSYEEMELIDLFKEIIDKDLSNNTEINFLLMVMISLLKRNQIQTPALTIFVEQLELELIFSCYNTDCQSKCEKKQPTKLSDEGLSAEQIEQIFWEKYVNNPFNPGPDARYQLPKEGSTLDLGVKDNEVFGDLYTMRFEIDSKGQVLKWIEKPHKVYRPENFNEIYSGLMGQIMEYQKM